MVLKYGRAYAFLIYGGFVLFVCFVGKPRVDTSRCVFVLVLYRIVVSFVRDDGGVSFASDLCMHASTQRTPK